MIGASSSLGTPARCEWLSKVWVLTVACVCARFLAHTPTMYIVGVLPRRLPSTRHLVFVTTCLFFPLSSLPATVPSLLSGRVPFAVLWACAFCPFLGVCPPLPPFSSPWRMSSSVPFVLPPPPDPTCPRCHTKREHHSSHTADALWVENMNLHPGGKQSVLREAFRQGKGRAQSMPCPNLGLAGEPERIELVRRERGLWPERGFVLECLTI